MKQTIYRYGIDVEDEVVLKMPRGARIISVGTKTPSAGSMLDLWAMCDPEETELESVRIRIVGTGHPIPDWQQLLFIGTVVVYDGVLVWHVFKVVV